MKIVDTAFIVAFQAVSVNVEKRSVAPFFRFTTCLSYTVEPGDIPESGNSVFWAYMLQFTVCTVQNHCEMEDALHKALHIYALICLMNTAVSG